MVVYNVVGSKGVEWALLTTANSRVLFVNALGPESLLAAAELTAIPKSTQKLIDYRYVENIDRVIDLIEDHTQVLVMENVSVLCKSMRYDGTCIPDDAIVNLVSMCRRSKRTIVLIEPNYNHFLSVLLDVDITT